MQHDKKARGGKVRMVLPTALGQVDVFDDIRDSEIADALAAMQMMAQRRLHSEHRVCA